MRGVLHKADAFIRQVKEDDRRAQDANGAQHLNIHDVADANHDEDGDLLEDASETDLRRQALVHDAAPQAGEVVQNSFMMKNLLDKK